MKPIRCLAIILIPLFLLLGCGSEEPSHTIVYANPPESIKILSKTPIQGEYTTLGNVYAESINSFGIKRQEATIHSILQHKAAEIGGDAIINAHLHHENIVATVIRLNDPVA